MINKKKFLESLYNNNTKNSINDKNWNVFSKIYSNIKNLTMNVGFQPVNLFRLHKVVIKFLYCLPLTLYLLVCVFF